MSLQDTPRANRLHVGIFGKINSGKSSLVNALTNQEVALVSPQGGTTTDPVYKAMEIAKIGPLVFIDTAGFEDTSALGQLREAKTKEAAKKSDIALLVISDDNNASELAWYAYFKQLNTPVIVIVNHFGKEDTKLVKHVEDTFACDVICVDVANKQNIEAIITEMIRLLPEDYEVDSICGDLCQAYDVVMLVMPQDIQAPKGRLILPQVQTIRDLLDKKCSVVTCTMDTYLSTLQILKQPPHLIICDSQVFSQVYEHKPKTSRLTSFSVLFAHYKGDVNAFMEGAEAIANLHEDAKILIAEACTHAPLSEDIGRVKIPRLLRKRFGESLRIEMVSGNDFPHDLQAYDLIIHCGACMFHRKYVLQRIKEAKLANVPITNYGVCLAYLSGILDKIDVQK